MKQKFKVGDRVRGVGYWDGKNINGKLGTIKEIIGYGYGVAFDEHIGGHELKFCGSTPLCKDGHGWYVGNSHVEAAQNDVIVIYRNGNEVIAHNKATGEKATSKCHPDDKFDFMIGAKIAFDRLVIPKPEPKKLYNGKLVCVEKDAPYYAFTVGKIYEVKDGSICIDNGSVFSDLTTLDDIHHILCAKFIEVVE